MDGSHTPPMALGPAFEAPSSGKGREEPRYTDDSIKTKVNIALLLNNLSIYQTENDTRTAEAQSRIRDSFEIFLRAQGYLQAEEDFAQLLEEKSGKRQFRKDGITPAFYHELEPILEILDLVRQDYITLDVLEEYGGLEVAICTHLRHDSIEDFAITFEDFAKSRSSHIDSLANMVGHQPSVFEPGYAQKQRDMSNRIVENIRLMTRKVAEKNPDGSIKTDSSGKIVKRALFSSTTDYMQKMLNAKDTANPVPYLLKLGDGRNNLSSLLNVPGITPEARKKYCDERHEMYGPLQGMNEKAQRKWPEVAEAISILDTGMGIVMYMNYGVLHHVDQFKGNHDDTIPEMGLERYFEHAFKLTGLPRAFNSIYRQIDRMELRAQTEPRMRKFLGEAVYPCLGEHRNYKPENWAALKPAAPMTHVNGYHR